jgi:hypothetical protein
MEQDIFVAAMSKNALIRQITSGGAVKNGGVPINSYVS